MTEETPPGPARPARILITGAGGFLGTALARSLLAAGHEVHGVVRDRARPGPIPEAARHPGDVRDAAGIRALVAAVAPQALFHAAVAREERGATREELFETNVAGTFHVLEAARAAGVGRIVHAASATELPGPGAAGPGTFYGATKAAATALALQASAAGPTEVVVARLFYVYGPGESRFRLIPAILHALATGEELPLAPSGLVRDWVHLDDAVEALGRALLRPDPGEPVLEIGSGEAVTNQEIVARMARLAGRPVRTRIGSPDSRPTDGTGRAADLAAARARLRWTPRVGLTEGLGRALREAGLMPAPPSP